MGFMENAMYAKIASICVILALLLFLIAFADPHWASTNPNKSTRNEYFGLWRRCTVPFGGSQTCTNFIDFHTGDWLKASQAFMTLGFFALLASIAAVAAAAFVPEFEGEPKAIAAAITVTGITTLFLLIGVAVFGDQFHKYFERDGSGLVDDPGQLDWAYGVACTSLILTFTACVLMVVETVLGRAQHY